MIDFDNFLRGKEAIREYMRNIDEGTLETYIAMGMPIRKIGGIYWSNKELINDWFISAILSGEMERKKRPDNRRPGRFY